MVRAGVAPVYLDTIGIIALLHRGDPHHRLALRWFAAIQRRRRPARTTTGVLSEVGDGFATRVWREAEPFLTHVCRDPMVTVVTVDCRLVDRALDLKRARADKNWGLTDCISFVVMTDRGCREALSADRDFSQAGFRALLLEGDPPVS